MSVCSVVNDDDKTTQARHAKCLGFGKKISNSKGVARFKIQVACFLVVGILDGFEMRYT